MMAEEQERILVVDDEPGVRNVLQRVLEQAGYEVATTDNGAEALYQISEGEVNILLLDIKMPGISGMEILAKITAEYPDVCVIMVTAVIDIQVAIEALKLGAYDYITKPFNREEVVQKVRNAIGKWKSLIKDKRQYLQLKEKFTEQTAKMQEQFTELVSSLSREHNLMLRLASRQGKEGKAMLKELPPELREPIASIEEFRDALLRILKKT
jgi:DNA-binding NtrC family response regulator